MNLDRLDKPPNLLSTDFFCFDCLVFLAIFTFFLVYLPEA
jgi:hypothetical protein